MKITVYKCDQCKQILSSDVEKRAHISISNGRMDLAYKKNSWLTHNLLTGHKQFCNTECLSSFLKEKIEELEDDVIETRCAII